MVALFATFTLTSCLSGVGSDENPDDVGNTSGFKVNVSSTVISADGEDTAIFSVLYNGEDVTAQSTLYNATTDEPCSSMSFSTAIAGLYPFYVTYDQYKSEVITITAVSNIDLSNKDEEGLSVALSTNLVQVGKNSATFIIRYNGKVLSADEIKNVKIYDATDDSQVQISDTQSVGSTFHYVVVSDNGTDYLLPAYSANQTGTKSFWVGYKLSNTRENPVSITAVNSQIPSSPVDSQPTNTNFVHRVLLTQMTGVGCGYCPLLKVALHELAEDSNYNNKYVHTAVHGKAFDNIFNVSVDGRDLGSILNVAGSYPYIFYDLADSHSGGYDPERNLEYLHSHIDSRLKNQARAGIAARTELKDNMLLVRTSVKVSHTGEYLVGAWLVESNLYAKQANYTELREDYLDYHNNVVRLADSNTTNFLGHSLGTIAKGERADHLFVMELDPSWKTENCHLVLFVSTVQFNKLTITNTVRTSSLTSGVEFEYR